MAQILHKLDEPKCTVSKQVAALNRGSRKLLELLNSSQDINKKSTGSLNNQIILLLLRSASNRANWKLLSSKCNNEVAVFSHSVDNLLFLPLIKSDSLLVGFKY